MNDDSMSSSGSSDIVNNNDVFSVANSYTEEHKKKKVHNLNPYIHVIERLRSNGKKRRLHKITLYATPNIPNAVIVNAVTNTRYNNYHVGTNDEDMFFSTMLATGECGKEAPLLFYDNPEQYEEHLMTELDMETKRRWYIRYYDLLAKAEKKNKVMLTLTPKNISEANAVKGVVVN
jgi:hypothetical protein